MRLLIITSSAPFGKKESFIITEANAIARLGHDVILLPTLIRKGHVSQDDLHENVKVLRWSLIRYSFVLNFLKSLFLQPYKIFRLFALSKDRSALNFIKNILVIPKAVSVSKYLNQSPVDHIHAHWLTSPSTLAMLVSELTGISWSATAHP